MLAGETAAGHFPVRAVQMLQAIICEAEATLVAPTAVAADSNAEHRPGRPLCEAAVALAKRSGAVAIIAITKAGKTPRMLASMRPDAHILAATTNQRTAAQLSLTWGVTAFVTAEITISRVRDVLRERQMVAPGDVVVFVAMHPRLTEEGRNFIHVEQI